MYDNSRTKLLPLGETYTKRIPIKGRQTSYCREILLFLCKQGCWCYFDGDRYVEWVISLDLENTDYGYQSVISYRRFGEME